MGWGVGDTGKIEKGLKGGEVLECFVVDWVSADKTSFARHLWLCCIGEQVGGGEVSQCVVSDLGDNEAGGGAWCVVLMVMQVLLLWLLLPLRIFISSSNSNSNNNISMTQYFLCCRVERLNQHESPALIFN